MTAEPTDSGEAALPNGSPPAKRARGRPKGSLNKKFDFFPRTITRVPKKVQLFCAASPADISRPPGRPKKKLRGRPRKIPLSPEEEAEIREQQKMHRYKKPLGRPRIHPIGNPKKKSKPGRPGRPSKYPNTPGRTTKPAAVAPSGPVVKRGRGRPPGSQNKRRSANFSHKKKKSPPPPEGATPRKRGRPPGSGNIQKRQKPDDGGPPKKRGRPPGPKRPEKPKSGRKRGRPSGALGKKKRRELAKHSEQGEVEIEVEDDKDIESAPIEDEVELGEAEVVD